VRTAAECGIPGLSLLLEFLSPKEEAALLALTTSQGQLLLVLQLLLLARRRVLLFGFVFDCEVLFTVAADPRSGPAAECHPTRGVAHR
jgi:hypothetical protein